MSTKKQELIKVAHFKDKATEQYVRECMSKPEQEKAANIAKTLRHFYEQDAKIRAERDRQTRINRARILYQQRTKKRA